MKAETPRPKGVKTAKRFILQLVRFIKNSEEIFEGVEYPNALDHFTGGVEYGFLSQLEGIEEHSVEIPADAAQHRIQRHAGLISFIPAAPFICEAILYLFDQLG